ILAAEHRLRSKAGEEEWARNHAAFHTALVSACGSRRLLALHAQLYEQSQRYRGLLQHLEQDRDVQAEHREIVGFALARDPEGLIRATAAHLRQDAEVIREACGPQADRS